MHYYTITIATATATSTVTTTMTTTTTNKTKKKNLMLYSSNSAEVVQTATGQQEGNRNKEQSGSTEQGIRNTRKRRTDRQ